MFARLDNFHQHENNAYAKFQLSQPLLPMQIVYLAKKFPTLHLCTSLNIDKN